MKKYFSFLVGLIMLGFPALMSAETSVSVSGGSVHVEDYGSDSDNASVHTATHIEARSGGNTSANTSADASVGTSENNDATVEASDSSEQGSDATIHASSVHIESHSENGKGSVHVEVHGWDPQDTKEIDVERDATTTGDEEVTVDVAHPEKVTSKDDLEKFVTVIVKKNSAIEDAHLSASSTEADVELHGRLLGIIPMALPARINAAEDGAVEMHLPWWHWLFFADPGNDPENLRAQLSASTTASSSSNILSDRANFFFTLAAFLGGHHE